MKKLDQVIERRINRVMLAGTAALLLGIVIRVIIG